MPRLTFPKCTDDVLNTKRGEFFRGSGRAPRVYRLHFKSGEPKPPVDGERGRRARAKT